VRRDFKASRFSFSHFLGDLAAEIMIFGDLMGDFLGDLTGEALIIEAIFKDIVVLFKDFFGETLFNTLNGDPVLRDYFVGDPLIKAFNGDPLF
jgi:hypothetical protein